MAQLHRRLSGFSDRRLSRTRRAAGCRRFATAYLVGLGLFSMLSSAAHAQPADAGASSITRRSLPTLPKPPSLELPRPERSELEQLDLLLSRVRTEDAEAREQAIRELLEVPPRLLSAIDRRMNAIADAGDRDGMKRTLESIRTKARADEREKLEKAGKRGQVETPDYLTMVSQHADPQSKAWQDLISVLAMSRMLVQIATVGAARELVDVYVRFGDFLRVDTQLQLEKLGDKAVAALIEARRHKAEKIGRWAERQLDGLGKAIPSEAVQTADHQVLADVLRAYGRVRDPDAARIVISFANSERAQVREAARQGVVLMGEVAAWQLRDTYETIVGKRPPRDWSWERTARELFGEFDRLRLAQTYDLFERGSAARAEGDPKRMKEAFDKVLARSPLFERRGEMADGYIEFARRRMDEDRSEALDALKRAERIAENDASRRAAGSLLLSLEAEQLLERGLADQLILRRAIELDASNTRARELLLQIERGESKKQSELRRWAAAAAIGLIAIVAIAFIGFRRARPKPGGEPSRVEPVPGSAGEPVPREQQADESQEAVGQSARSAAAANETVGAPETGNGSNVALKDPEEDPR